jgi:hypothetical protein
LFGALTSRSHRYDEELFLSFKEGFPWYFEDKSRLEIVDEEVIKSAEGKAKWRAWIKPWEKKIGE